MSALPAGWAETTIGRVCTVVSGSTPKTSEPSYWGGDVPWITPDDLARNTSKYIDHGRRSITHRGFESCSARMVPPGTVVFTSRAPIGYTAIATTRLCTNQGFKSLVPPDGIRSDFLYWYLRHATPLIRSRASGTTFSEISAKGMSSIPLLIPPTSEQDRIVAAIEEQFSCIDAGTTVLNRALANVKRIRRSVLEEALGGFARRLDGSQISELPAGWSWEALAEVCVSVTDGDHQPPPQVNDGIPFLVIGNVRSGMLSFDGCRHVPLDYYRALLPPRRPQRGDVLYTLVGSYGIPALVRDDRPFCVQRHIGILRPSSLINSAYLAVAMASNNAFRQARECATGTAQMTVPLSGLRALTIPVPPLHVQREIVSNLDRSWTSFGKLNEAILTLLKRAEALRSSILAAAFAGALVPQDKNDEPASLLLGRVRQMPRLPQIPARAGREVSPASFRKVAAK